MNASLSLGPCQPTSRTLNSFLVNALSEPGFSGSSLTVSPPHVKVTVGAFGAGDGDPPLGGAVGVEVGVGLGVAMAPR